MPLASRRIQRETVGTIFNQLGPTLMRELCIVIPIGYATSPATASRQLDGAIQPGSMVDSSSCD
jgi:hypothetical protein